MCFSLQAYGQNFTEANKKINTIGGFVHCRWKNRVLQLCRTTGRGGQKKRTNRHPKLSLSKTRCKNVHWKFQFRNPSFRCHNPLCVHFRNRIQLEPCNFILPICSIGTQECRKYRVCYYTASIFQSILDKPVCHVFVKYFFYQSYFCYLYNGSAFQYCVLLTASRTNSKYVIAHAILLFNRKTYPELLHFKI